MLNIYAAKKHLSINHDQMSNNLKHMSLNHEHMLDIYAAKKHLITRDGSRSALYRYSTRDRIESRSVHASNLPDRVSSPEIAGSDHTVIPTREPGFVEGHRIFCVYRDSTPLQCNRRHINLQSDSL
jgi:hypothetical protein